MLDRLIGCGQPRLERMKLLQGVRGGSSEGQPGPGLVDSGTACGRLSHSPGKADLPQERVEQPLGGSDIPQVGSGSGETVTVAPLQAAEVGIGPPVSCPRDHQVPDGQLLPLGAGRQPAGRRRLRRR